MNAMRLPREEKIRPVDGRPRFGLERPREVDEVTAIRFPLGSSS